jgi:preprotein translocase subunit SecB
VSLHFDEVYKLVEISTERAVVEVSYTIKGKLKRTNIFSLAATYVVVFDTLKEIPKEFFETYNQVSLPLQTFPYLRELTNSVVSRMGFPPLVLPLRKYLTAGS